MNTIAEKISILESKTKKMLEMGGQKAVDAQHNKGKWTARERIAYLFDEGTFREIDMFVKHRCTNFNMQNDDIPSDGVITGHGLVNGRVVFAYAQDFTAKAGTLGEMQSAKICKIMDLALKAGKPVVGMNDSGGARIQEGIDALCGYGNIFFRNARSSGVIPQISAIMGPCAGGAVYSPAMTDFVFMVKKSSFMFITGPDVIKAVTGEETTQEELGGAMAHNTRSGNAHFACEDDQDCIDQIKNLLTYLPDNNLENAPYIAPKDNPTRLCPKLDEIIPDDPKMPYNMIDVITEIVDDYDFFEVHEYYAQNLVVGFARLNGRIIGIIANQPQVLAGCLDIDASDKAARFIRTCDSFNIPLLTLVDVPGYLPGTHQEWNGIIRHGAKLLWVYSEATVPKLTVVTRKNYGGSYIAMSSKHLGADMIFAWPSSEIAVMGAQGAANIMYRKEIAEAADPASKRVEKIEEYEELFSNPYRAAERGYIDAVIRPTETRMRLIDALEAMSGKTEELPYRKHGNVPL
jgi:acetyl-CoA carboxylase carboxyltransferase component